VNLRRCISTIRHPGVITSCVVAAWLLLGLQLILRGEGRPTELADGELRARIGAQYYGYLCAPVPNCQGPDQLCRVKGSECDNIGEMPCKKGTMTLITVEERYQKPQECQGDPPNGTQICIPNNGLQIPMVCYTGQRCQCVRDGGIVKCIVPNGAPLDSRCTSPRDPGIYCDYSPCSP
jgi:hypothetical protein